MRPTPGPRSALQLDPEVAAYIQILLTEVRRLRGLLREEQTRLAWQGDDRFDKNSP